MKAKTILAAVFTAICLASCILDWDLAMYLSGLIAIFIIGIEDLQINFREMTEKFRQFSVKNSVTSRSIRKEVVKA